MSRPHAIVAGILIGGKGTRMGRDKPTLPYGHSTLVEHVVHVSEVIAEQCVLLGPRHDLPGTMLRLRRLPDAFPHIGPIGALCSLLHAYPHDWCAVIACDLPLLETRTLCTLRDHLDDQHAVVAFEDDGRLEPCCALYHGSLADTVTAAIRPGRYSLHALLRSSTLKPVAIDASLRKTLTNVNTPEQYHRLR